MPVESKAMPTGPEVPAVPAEEQPIRLKASESSRAPVPPAAAVGPATQAVAEPASGHQKAAPLTQPEAPASVNSKKPNKKGNMGAVLAAVVILLLAGGATIWLAGKWKKDQADGNSANLGTGTNLPMSGDAWIERGWKKEASSVLGDFMAAKSPEEKMKYVIPNDGVLEELKVYFPNGKTDTDTPLSAFSFSEDNRQDRERGIFLMRYSRPAQIDIREYFAPIGNIETVMGQETPSLIETAHRINEDSLSQPVGINAFFKKTDDGLKLDASVFIQGKFRTFKAFTEYPQPGKSKVFRVVASEVLSHALRDDATRRTYKLADYAYQQDFVIVPVEVESEVGKILSVLNWRGSSKRVFPRTATVEIAWTDTTPSVLELRKVLCWEFLGVGGKLGNTSPPEAPKASPAKAPVKTADNP